MKALIEQYFHVAHYSVQSGSPPRLKLLVG